MDYLNIPGLKRLSIALIAHYSIWIRHLTSGWYSSLQRKKLIRCSLAAIVLGSASNFLYSQETVTSIDSIVTYRFISEFDSVQSSIRIIERIDSIQRYESDWSGIWNSDSAKWIPEQKSSRELDLQGHQIFYAWSQWNVGYGWEKRDSVWTDYDASGNKTFNDSYKWNTDRQEWNGERRDEYFRDGDGVDTLSIVSGWDQATNDWQYTSRLRTIYDEGHRVLESFYYNWNSSENVWELAEWKQYEYVFNVSGDVETRISYTLNPEDSTRNQGSLTEYSYDEQHRVLKEELYLPDKEASIMLFITEYAYDAAGNLTLHSTLFWNYLPDTVVNGSRNVYAFDIQGRNTLEDALIWDAEMEEWLLYDRTITTYDEKDQITAKDYTYWNIPGDGELQSKHRLEFLYTGTGKDSVKITYAWNYSQQELYLLTKTFYYRGDKYYTAYDSICEGAVYVWRGQSLVSAGTYMDAYTSATGADSTYVLILSALPSPASYGITGLSDVAQGQEALYTTPEDESLEYRWNVDNGTVLSGAANDSLRVWWQDAGTGEVSSWALNEYGCSSDTATLTVHIGLNGTDDPCAAGFTLYPVPVRKVLHVECGLEFPEIRVTDLSGRQVAIARGTSIDLSDLTSGTYVVHLRDQNGALIGTRKIIKE